MTESAESWREAIRDLAGGLSRPWLWIGLGWNDIRQRYRGSLLGSLWITINISLLVGSLTLIFAEPFGTHRALYAPYVGVGLVFWYFIQGTINDSCQVFIGSADTIRNSAMPLSVHVLRLLCRNSIVLAHNLVIIPVVLIAFKAWPDLSAWTALPGLALLILATFWASLLLGLLGARYRDISQVVSNLLQLLFFLTPIFWPLSALGERNSWIVALNPVFPFIDIIRSPLLGAAPAPASWPIALGLTSAAAALALVALARLRSRVAYWV
jgi:ABC-type polysaccharide/polyol phosphate export permease